jgi:hypothetical protein
MRDFKPSHAVAPTAPTAEIRAEGDGRVGVLTSSPFHSNLRELHALMDLAACRSPKIDRENKNADECIGMELPAYSRMRGSSQRSNSME